MEARSCGALPARLGDALIVPSKMRVRFLTCPLSNRAPGELEHRGQTDLEFFVE